MINKFLDYIKSKIGCGYVWGSQGQTLTPELLNYFKKSFGEKHYDFGTTHASKWLGNQCFDCSGLVVAALNELGLIKMDYTAAGLYGICKNLKKTELRAGDLVFCKGTSINHVGVYVGNGEVIEAKGTAYGVVKSKLEARFNLFGRLNFFEADKEHWAEQAFDELQALGCEFEVREFDRPITRGEFFAGLVKFYDAIK